MRKGLFALVLVAASFAGGAAINGPGLAWARGLFEKLAHPRVAALARVATPREADEPPPPGRPDPASDIPEAARAPLGLDAPRLAPPPSRSRPEAPAPPEPLAPPDLGPPALPDLKANDGDGDGDGEKPDAGRPRPLPVAGPPLVPAPPIPTPEGPAKTDRAVAHAGGSAAPRDWAGLRKRMVALGVARYWVEGEPGGPCRFRCVIPTAGGQAVGQHFEAEGDDDFHAAEAAMRRVVLWKATEAP